MFKKTMATMLAGAGLMALVGSASAADININIYGASAQYKFWNSAAAAMLGATGSGCSAVQKATDGTNGIAKATCGANTVYIRYSSKNSLDGIYSCKGVDPLAVTTCSDKRQRLMADESTADWTGGKVTSLACKTVTIGASDVAGGTFGQTTTGRKNGCNGAATVDTYSANAPAADTSSLTKYYRPIIVPFGFFANNAVGADVTNLTRLQALMIFSGTATAWSDFGAAYPEKSLAVCFRHAGSGTHATLAAAVMRKDVALSSRQDCASGNAPILSFNDGSGDMMKCVNTNVGLSTDEYAAVGYADADALTGSGATSYPNVKALNYEGAAPTPSNIANGVYSFWSHQWLYQCDQSDANVNTWVAKLNTYASSQTSIDAAGLGAYWVAAGSMNVSKLNDFVMPSF